MIIVCILTTQPLCSKSWISTPKFPPISFHSQERDHKNSKSSLVPMLSHSYIDHMCIDNMNSVVALSPGCSQCFVVSCENWEAKSHVWCLYNHSKLYIGFGFSISAIKDRTHQRFFSSLPLDRWYLSAQNLGYLWLAPLAGRSLYSYSLSAIFANSLYLEYLMSCTQFRLPDSPAFHMK